MHAFGSLIVIVSLLAAAQPDQAATVLAAARTALGGEARIAGVRTFIASGRTRQIRGNNLVPIEFEIQSELPDKYARRDEVPAQDTAPSLSGFNGDTLILVPRPPAQQAAAAQGRVVTAKQDFARLVLGMFAISVISFPLTFAYAGQAEAPQGKADVLDVTGPANFKARLFINNQTHLPIMVSWPGPPPQAVEQRLYFADYREVDGFQLPFRIRRASGADTTEETTFDRFRINARIDPRRFESGG